MSIVVAEKTFKTLSDKFYVNGKQVIEAYCNDVKVYPDDYDIIALKITYEPVESTDRHPHVYKSGLEISQGTITTLGSFKGDATLLVTRYKGNVFVAAISYSKADFPTGKIDVDGFSFTKENGWRNKWVTTAKALDSVFGNIGNRFEGSEIIPDSNISPQGVRVDDPNVTIKIIESR